MGESDGIAGACGYVIVERCSTALRDDATVRDSLDSGLTLRETARPCLACVSSCLHPTATVCTIAARVGFQRDTSCD